MKMNINSVVSACNLTPEQGSLLGECMSTSPCNVIRIERSDKLHELVRILANRIGYDHGDRSPPTHEVIEKMTV